VLPSLAFADEKQPFLGLLGGERNREDQPGEKNRGDAHDFHGRHLRSAIFAHRQIPRAAERDKLKLGRG
jgi:hypothetical protein